MKSLSEFLAMGGYAFFVWTAYGIATVVLAANVVLPILHKRRLLAELARKARRARRAS